MLSSLKILIGLYKKSHNILIYYSAFYIVTHLLKNINGFVLFFLIFFVEIISFSVLGADKSLVRRRAVGSASAKVACVIVSVTGGIVSVAVVVNSANVIIV